MNLSIKCLCGVKAFPSEATAERRLARIQALGLRSEMPSTVVSCTFGQWHIADPMPVANLARTTEISKVSDKRKAENRERRKVALATFGRNPMCAVPRCTEPAVDVHEPLTRGRGGSITDPDNMVPLCRPHHDEIQLGPEWAYQQDLMKHSWPGDAA
ncbi:MAG: hypothetical protein JWN52_6607 [Actinomycetia bacterium]|nr:hypothetical protein [Actinomycetes bacterium]